MTPTIPTGCLFQIHLRTAREGEVLVMLVKNDGEETPPLGSVGEIVGIEPDGDLLVEFVRYPCPAGPETSWCCPEHWLIPLDLHSNEDGTYTDNRMVILAQE
jgi:hypothetical protein